MKYFSETIKITFFNDIKILLINQFFIKVDATKFKRILIL